ncbi:hypothetical protein FBU59_004784 [Linderina macrospora]|uniref:Uncharacterized protein n=1 Tax=Linderina macrospora TaxID=4868 RepID=A0ACC1J4T6_9FUNG|nr:hypothetical protein FBU59_004784 [Linderina macrospora]
MDDICAYLRQCADKAEEVDTKYLAELLAAGLNDETLCRSGTTENDIAQTVLFLSQQTTMSLDKVKQLMERVFRTNFDDMLAPKRPLDFLKRTAPTLSKKAVTSSAEGAKLRQRNLAKMTNEEYEAVAAKVQPTLVDNLADFAAQSGMVPPSPSPPPLRGHQRYSTFSARSTRPAAGDMVVPDRDAQSDSRAASCPTADKG